MSVVLRFVLVVALCSACAPLPPADIPTPQPKKSEAVVFDIDGTLTPKVHAAFTARPHASRAVQILADKGYEIFYLSSRAPSRSAWIPGWLDKNDFPDGTVHVAQSREDHTNPAEFKTRKLAEFIVEGWNITLAYGDSSTDFQAYASVGIPTDAIFALRRVGESSCQPGQYSACLNGWTEHLEFLSDLDEAE